MPKLRTKIAYGEGRKWATEFSLTTGVLNLLAAEGRIVPLPGRGAFRTDEPLVLGVAK